MKMYSMSVFIDKGNIAVRSRIDIENNTYPITLNITPKSCNAYPNINLFLSYQAFINLKNDILSIDHQVTNALAKAKEDSNV